VVNVKHPRRYAVKLLKNEKLLSWILLIIYTIITFIIMVLVNAGEVSQIDAQI
jgi:hypothetical protein